MNAFLLLYTVASARLCAHPERVPAFGAGKPQVEPDAEVVRVAAGTSTHFLNAAPVAQRVIQ